MKKIRFLSFITTLFASAIVIPLSSCGVEHTPAEEWSHDSTNHWHECVDENCDEKLDEEAHTFGEWKILKSATCLTTGIREKVCTVCGYKVQEEIPIAEHKLGAWVHDHNKHWKECADCGEKFEEAAHEYGEVTILKEPTCLEYGTASKKCKTCGFELVYSLPKVDHKWTGYSFDESHHERRCEVCGKIETSAHEWSDYVVTEDGHSRTCKVCGCKQDDEHMYFEKERKEPTCTEDGYILYECVCGKQKTTVLPKGHQGEQQFSINLSPTFTGKGVASIKCPTCEEENLVSFPGIKTMLHDYQTFAEYNVIKDRTGTYKYDLETIKAYINTAYNSVHLHNQLDGIAKFIANQEFTFDFPQVTLDLTRAGSNVSIKVETYDADVLGYIEGEAYNSASSNFTFKKTPCADYSSVYYTHEYVVKLLNKYNLFKNNAYLVDLLENLEIDKKEDTPTELHSNLEVIDYLAFDGTNTEGSLTYRCLTCQSAETIKLPSTCYDPNVGAGKTTYTLNKARFIERIKAHNSTYDDAYAEKLYNALQTYISRVG